MPTNIYIVSSNADTNNLSDVDNFNDADLNTSGNPPSTSVDVNAINNATSLVYLQSKNLINVSSQINIAAPSVGLTAQAGGNILFGAMGVNYQINTNNGAITLSANDGGAGTATGSGGLFLGGNLASGGATIALTTNNGSGAVALYGNVDAQTGTVTISNGTGSITQAGGAITAGTLSVNSLGTVALNQANFVGTLGASSSGSGGFSFNSAQQLAVTGSVNTMSSGPTSLSANSQLTIGANIGNVTNATTLTAVGAGGSIVVGTSSLVSGSSVTLTADQYTLQGNISAGPTGSVTIQNSTLGRSLSLGNSSNLTPSELNNITAGTLTVGRNDASATGQITLTQDFSSLNVSTFVLKSGSDITDNGHKINVTALDIVAGGDVNFTGSDAVSYVAGSAGGAFTFTGAGPLTIGTVAGTTGITAANATITSGGELTLASAVNVGSGTATIISSGAVTQTGGAITAATLTGSATGAASFGSATNDIANLGAFSSTGLSLTTAHVGQLGLSGAVTVGTSGTLTLVETVGGINQTGGSITAGVLSGSANGSSMFTASGNDIAGLGAFDTTNSGGNGTGNNLSVNTVHAGQFSLTGAVTLGTSGVLTLTDLSGSIAQTSGLITAASLAGSSKGGASFTSATNAISGLGTFTDTNNGNLSLRTGTGSLSLNGNVSLGTGTLTLIETGGGIKQTSGSITAGIFTGTAAGSVSLTNTNNAINNLGAFTITGDNSLSIMSSASPLAVAGTISTGLGSINLQDAQPFGLLSVTNAGSLLSTGSISLTADQMSVVGQVGGSGAGTGSASSVTIASSSGATSIGLGSASGNLTLGTSDLNNIRAVNVTVGNSGSGPLTLGSYDATGSTFATGTLTLVSPTAATISGNVKLLGGLSVNTSGVNLNASVQTAGAQSYQGPGTLGADDVLASTGSGAVTFGGTLDGAHALTVNTAGATTFSGAVGATAALTALTTDVNGTTAINGASVRTLGAQTYNDVVTFGADTTLTSTSGGAITLANAANAFDHMLSLSAGSATIVNTKAIGLGTVDLGSGGFSLTAAGAVTQTGAAHVTGTTTLTAGSTNDITLTNAGNDFGAVGITSARNVSLADANAITLGASTLAGTLSVSAGGAITQSGVLAVTTGTTVGASGTITLDTTGNDLGGSVTANAGGNVTLRDAAGLTQVNISTTGTVVLTETSGAINDSDGATDITAAAAAIRGDAGIGTTGAIQTIVSTLAFTNTTGTVNIANTGALTIGAAGGLTTSSNAGGTTTISAASPLTVAANLTSGGTLSLSAGDSVASGDNLTVNSNVLISSTTGNVSLQAGENISLGAGSTVSANGGAGTVTLSAGHEGGGSTAALNGTITATTLVIQGGSGADVITLGTGFSTTASSVTLIGGAGNDQLTGIAGTGDIARYSGAQSDYRVTAGAGGVYTIQDLRAGSPDGTDTVTGIDFLQFSTGSKVSIASFIPQTGGGTPSIPSQPTLFGASETNSASPAGAVYGLYKALLGHAPDPLGLEAFAGSIQNGATPTDVAAAILASPEYAAKNPSPLTDGAYVSSLYGSLLNRAPDVQGAAFFQGELSAGVSRATVASQIATSPEAQTVLQPTFANGVFVANATDAQIARLYYGILGRTPDAGGLSSFEAQAKGLGLAGVAQTMLSGQEFSAKFGNLSDTAYIDALYVGALGHHADAAALSYWGSQLPGAGRVSVAVQIAQSQEAQVHLVGVIEQGMQVTA